MVRQGVGGIQGSHVTGYRVIVVTDSGPLICPLSPVLRSHEFTPFATTLSYEAALPRFWTALLPLHAVSPLA